ncbi:unnamed protein product, partial [Rotaria sp. Silwood2]
SGFFSLDHDSNDDTKQPGDLVEFLDLNNNHYYHKESLSPIIYIGFCSITGHDSERILQVVLEALEKTGYRAVLSSLAKDDDKLPKNALKIGNVSHDWLFPHGEFNYKYIEYISVQTFVKHNLKGMLKHTIGASLRPLHLPP